MSDLTAQTAHRVRRDPLATTVRSTPTHAVRLRIALLRDRLRVTLGRPRPRTNVGDTKAAQPECSAAPQR
jgi:hypothetical protein